VARGLRIARAVASLARTAVCAFALTAASRALGETRTYEILVDRAVVGQSVVTIAHGADGALIATTDARLSVSWVVFTYVYEFHGQEVWNGGRFERLASRAVDGGKKLSLNVTRSGSGFSIAPAGSRPSTAPEIGMTTNYWLLPRQTGPHGEITVADADTGKLQNCRLEQVGEEAVSTAAGPLQCAHYRLVGGVQADLWFDGQGLLVRHTGVEDGHATELRLKSLEPTPPWTAARK
jgi:hypothetical protein